MKHLNILSLLIISVAVQGEYYVKFDVIPSYLYRRFDDIREAFPRNIHIVMALTSINGILFYSIDSHMNQMIVTLSGKTIDKFEIEFRGQRSILALSKLCGCNVCEFKNISLMIEVRDEILIQCNHGLHQNIKYNQTKGLNTDYPIPFTKNQFEENKTNEAHLWMVNHQHFDITYTNSIQLSGCIFNVMYKQKEINFNTVSNIEQMCQRVCTASICNGGNCLETFNGKPLCNCLTTFNNGLYCNDSMKSVNKRISSLKLMIAMLKLSWTSDSNDIFRMENEKVRFEIFRRDSDLFFEYSDKNDRGLKITSTLSNDYIPRAKYRFIMVFHEDRIDIDIYEDNKFYHTSIRTTTNLKNEIFTTVILRSGDGTIDVAFKKDTTEISLRKINMSHYTILQQEISKRKAPDSTKSSLTEVSTQKEMDPVTKHPSPQTKTNDLLIALVVLLVVGIVVGLVVGALKYFKIIKPRQEPQNTAEEIPFIQGHGSQNQLPEGKKLHIDQESGTNMLNKDNPGQSGTNGKTDSEERESLTQGGTNQNQLPEERIQI